MKIRPTAMLALAAFLTLLALNTTATAAADDGALKFLKARHDVVRSILKKKAKTPAQVKKRNTDLDAALQALLDFEELSKRALADHWDGLEEKQRKDFVDLLSQLIQRNYQNNLESTLDFQIKYTGEEKKKEGVLVHTRARSRENRRAPEVEIDYNLLSASGGWKVYDVITDGVSLVSNYKTQFNRIIRRDGWDSLIERMRKSLNSEDGLL